MANAVEIVISANDRASGAIATIATGLGGVGKAAQLATLPIQALSNAVFDLGTKAGGQITAGLINPLGLISTVLTPLTGVFATVNSVAQSFSTTLAVIQNQPIISIAAINILREAERAIEDLDSNLTSTFFGVKEAADPFIKGLFPQLPKIAQESEAAIENLGKSFLDLSNVIGSSLSSGINKVDSIINKTIEKLEIVPQRIANRLQGVGNVFAAIAGFDEPLAVFDALRQTVGGVTQGIFAATQEIAFFSAGLQALQQFVGQGPFRLLIGQNIELQEQLLATQSALAATSKISQFGENIKDPGLAIQSLTTPINNAIGKLREGSLELVGVTSQQLVPLFQQVAGKATAIGANLTESVDLSLDFAAALGTLNIPLFQANQEIGSILTGTIDVNSVLAKSIGLTNTQIAQYKTQGTLVEELSKRLQAFRAGNAIAAQTIGGVTSNIEELFNEIARIAGKPLLEPVIRELNNFYSFLNENRSALGEGITEIVGLIQRAGEASVKVAKTLFGATADSIGQVPEYLFKSLTQLIEGVAKAVDLIVPIIQPVIEVFGILAEKALALGGPFLQIFLTFTIASKAIGLVAGSFGTLAQTLPGIGELLFFLTGRNSSLIKTFIGLRGEIGQGAAGFLLLGKNLASIPPLAGLLASQIPIFGGAIASLVPSISQLAIQGLGILKVYPQVGQVFQNLTKFLPTIATAAGPLADQILPGFGAALQNAAGQAANFGVALGKSTAPERIAAIEALSGATNRFSGLMQQLGTFVGQSAIKFTLLTGGIIIAIQAFDQLVLKNENLLATLKAFGNTLQQIGGAVVDFLSNPAVIATAAVVGLTVAIQSGLIATLAQLSKAFITTAAGDFAVQLQKVTQTVTAFSSAIASASSDQIVDFFGGERGQLKKQAESLAKEIEDGTAAYNQSVVERKNKIAALKQEIENIDIGDIRLQGEDSGLGELISQQNAQQKELDNIIAERKNQRQKLDGLNVEIAKRPALTEKVSKTIGNLRTQATDFVSSIDLSREGLSRFAASAGTAANSAAKAGAAILSTTAGVVAAAAPILILVAAITVVTEAIGSYITLTELSTKRTQEFAEAITAADKAQRLAAESRGKNLPGNDDPRVRRLKEIEKEIGLVTKLTDAVRFFGTNVLSGAGLLDGVYKQFGVEIDRSGTAQQRLNAEIQDQGSLFQNADAQLKVLQAGKFKDIKLNQELANLQRQQVEAQAKGQKANANSIGVQIKQVEAEINARKEGVDSLIKNLESVNPSSQSAIKAQGQLVKQFKDFRNELDEIPNTQITPADLPKLGTSLEQLTQKAKTAGDAVSASTGNPEEFKKQAQILIETTQLQLKAGQITEEEARSRLERLAGNVNADAELQIQAQEAITASYETEGQKRLSAFDNQISQIEVLAAQGVITQTDADRQTTEVKKQQLQAQLQATEQALNEEVTAGREASEKSVQLQKQAAQTRAQLAKLGVEQEQKEIERASKKALEQVEAAEKQRSILIQQLRNSNQITETDAAALSVESRKQQIKGELAAENDKLKQLLQNENLNSEQIKESRKKILDLTLASLKTEEEAYNAYTNRVRAAIERQVTDRQIAIQRSANQGLITEEQANQERIRLDVARLQAELQAETRNADRRRQLTLELAQAEGQLREASIAAIDRKLNDSAQAYENRIKAQNAELEKQVGLYDLLGEALKTQSDLLEAQRNVLSAAEGFLTGQINAVGQLERSEFRRKQLAQITAAIQLDSLAQRQETERRIFEIQQRQNQLAIERQRIENEIAISQKEAEIARSKAQVVRGEEELKAGKITRPEFEARQLELRANEQGLLALQRQRSLITEQAKLQPQLEAAARQQFELQQKSAQTEATVNFANTLRPGQLRQVRRPLQNQLAQSLGFEDQFDLRQQGLGAVRNLVGDLRSGRAPEAGLFQQLSPRSQGIAGDIEQSITQLPSQFGSIAQQNLQISQQLQQVTQDLELIPRQTLEARPTAQLQLPSRQLLDIEAIRKDQQAQFDRQSQRPSLTQEQVTAIADSFWNRFGGSMGETKIEAPINVVVNAAPGENAQAAAEIVDQRLKQTVERANQLVRGAGGR